MNINLHIERLVLVGLPPGSGRGPELQAALESEVVRLLNERGLGGVTAGAVPSLAVAAIELPASASAADWGRQIAHTLGEGLVRSPAKHQQPRAVIPTAAPVRDSSRAPVNQRGTGRIPLYCIGTQC